MKHPAERQAPKLNAETFKPVLPSSRYSTDQFSFHTASAWVAAGLDIQVLRLGEDGRRRWLVHPHFQIIPAHAPQTAAAVDPPSSIKLVTGCACRRINGFSW